MDDDDEAFHIGDIGYEKDNEAKNIGGGGVDHGVDGSQRNGSSSYRDDSNHKKTNNDVTRTSAEIDADCSANNPTASNSSSKNNSNNIDSDRRGSHRGILRSRSRSSSKSRGSEPGKSTVLNSAGSKKSVGGHVKNLASFFSSAAHASSGGNNVTKKQTLQNKQPQQQQQQQLYEKDLESNQRRVQQRMQIIKQTINGEKTEKAATTEGEANSNQNQNQNVNQTHQRSESQPLSSSSSSSPTHRRRPSYRAFLPSTAATATATASSPLTDTASAAARDSINNEKVNETLPGPVSSSPFLQHQRNNSNSNSNSNSHISSNKNKHHQLTIDTSNTSAAANHIPNKNANKSNANSTPSNYAALSFSLPSSKSNTSKSNNNCHSNASFNPTSIPKPHPSTSQPQHHRFLHHEAPRQSVESAMATASDGTGKSHGQNQSQSHHSYSYDRSHSLTPRTSTSATTTATPPPLTTYTTTTTTANTTANTTATINTSMIQPKSHQRLILEQVAAQYFLQQQHHSDPHSSHGETRGYYPCHDTYDDFHNGYCRNEECGNDSNKSYGTNGPVDVDADIHDPSNRVLQSTSSSSPSKMLWHPLHKFLDGIPCGEQDQHSQSQSQSHSLSRRSDDGDTQRGHIGDEDDEHDDDECDNVDNDENARNNIDIHGSVVGNNDIGTGNGTTSFENDQGGLRHDDDKRDTKPRQNHYQDASLAITPLFQQPKTPLNVQDETDIDRILEMASDHLSLGQNELALQAYRRAMKCAFADVISVKRQLMEVKKLQKRQQKRQQQLRDDVRGIDPSPVNSPSSTSTSDMELTKQQEQRFELTLLQVASRVADIHNNMGVVHEMNRSFEKAQASYQDALDVYHNTCRRFEQEGDSDVERANRNVARMISACRSEQERKSLHDRAAKIAKRVEYEKHFATRKNLLNDAVATLQMALELEGEALGHSHPLAASTLIQMGKYHYEMREFDSAVMEIHKAVQILRNALGGNHPQVGRALLLLASVYERQGPKITPHGTSKDDVELELYVDALEPLKATLGNVHDDVGFLYVKIGYLYGKKGDRNMALLAYKAALKAYGEPSFCLSPEDVHPEVVSVWVRVTEHLVEIKSMSDAVLAGQRALYLLRLTKDSLFRGAQLNNYSGDASIGSASTTAVRTSKKSPIQINSTTYYPSLFTTLQCLGQAHTALVQYPLAKEACLESLQMAWEIALATQDTAIAFNSLSPSATKPKNQAVIDSILQVIRALKRLGKVHLLQTHYNDALQCFLPCLQLLRSSKDMECTLDAASVLGSLGFLHLKMQRFMEASNFLKECLRLYRRNGVNQNDRETRKVQAWLHMAEAKEAESDSAPPAFLEIPTIIFPGENDGLMVGNGRNYVGDIHESDKKFSKNMSKKDRNVEIEFGKLNIRGNDKIIPENYNKNDGSADFVLNESGQYEL